MGEKVTDEQRYDREGVLDIREAERAVREGQPAKVTVLKPKPPEPTLAEEIVAALEGLAAAIKSGELIPSHLVIGYGAKTDIDGEPATHYDWDAIGINTYEVIGHLSVYVTRLAMGEGE